MTKDELNAEITAQLAIIKDQAALLHKLVEDLQLTLRPTSDTTFVVMDVAKEYLANCSEVKAGVDKIRKALKLRALAKMKDT